MLKIALIPAFLDNYFFCISSDNSSSAAIVDPGQAVPVIEYLEKNNLMLDYIFVTHHHSDHVGGVKELKEKYQAKVLGPKNVSPDKILKEGNHFTFLEREFEIFELPGHTHEHLAFYQKDERLLFCGDVLFSLGCGRIFEGTFEEMFESLNILKNLPDETKVFCAHEYTLTNLNFSLSYVENLEKKKYLDLKEKIVLLRSKNIPTIPSSIGFEKKFNLFLKAKNIEEFKRVRLARNNF